MGVGRMCQTRLVALLHLADAGQHEPSRVLQRVVPMIPRLRDSRFPVLVARGEIPRHFKVLRQSLSYFPGLYPRPSCIQQQLSCTHNLNEPRGKESHFFQVTSKSSRCNRACRLLLRRRPYVLLRRRPSVCSCRNSSSPASQLDDKTESSHG